MQAHYICLPLVFASSKGDGGESTSTIRLAGGPNENSGRVEIYREGEWGTICDDSWYTTEGSVACKQLGFTGIDRVGNMGEFGSGTADSPILASVDCEGFEDSLDLCESTDWGTIRCSHAEDAGVICQTGKNQSTCFITYRNISSINQS